MFSVSRIALLLSICVNFHRYSIAFSLLPQCSQNTVVPNQNSGLLQSLNIFTNNNNYQKGGKLVMGCCMECMCPFTRNWFLNEWCPIMNQMLPCVEMHYVISGNQNRNGGKYSCQHGEKECALNEDARNCGKVLQNSTNYQSTFGCYLCCVFGIDGQNLGFETISQRCCAKCNINYNSIKKLRGTKTSTNLWDQCASFTSTVPGYRGTPNLAFCNGRKYDTSMTDGLQTKLQQSMCQLLGSDSRCCKNNNYNNNWFGKILPV